MASTCINWCGDRDLNGTQLYKAPQCHYTFYKHEKGSIIWVMVRAGVLARVGIWDLGFRLGLDLFFFWFHSHSVCHGVHNLYQWLLRSKGITRQELFKPVLKNRKTQVYV